MTMKNPDNDKIVYIADGSQMPLCNAELIFRGDTSGGIHGCHETTEFECIACGTWHRFVLK